MAIAIQRVAYWSAPSSTCWCGKVVDVLRRRTWSRYSIGRRGRRRAAAVEREREEADEEEEQDALGQPGGGRAAGRGRRAARSADERRQPDAVVVSMKAATTMRLPLAAADHVVVLQRPAGSRTSRDDIELTLLPTSCDVAMRTQ